MTAPSVDEVPWDDAPALHAWVVLNAHRVTALALRRLLTSHGFECVGTAPTRTKAICEIYAHRQRLRDPALAQMRVPVYYNEHQDGLAGLPRVGAVLLIIAGARERMQQLGWANESTTTETEDGK